MLIEDGGTCRSRLADWHFHTFSLISGKLGYCIGFTAQQAIVN